MGLQRYIVNFPRLSPGLLEAWRAVPSRVVADALGCGHSVAPDIRSCAPGVRLCGQARTVAPMPGDNSVLLTACSLAQPGDVVVVGGAGLESVAVAGQWVARSGKSRGLGGLVIDGAVRDLPEIRGIGFPVFAKGAVPRAPHRAVGGKMDLPVMVGGVAVSPGDLLVGDDDGVAVVPLLAAEALRQCQDWMTRPIRHPERQLPERTVAERALPEGLILEIGAAQRPHPAPIEAALPLLTALALPDPDAFDHPALR
ncbi:RraA family protein [Azospirillum canadense]|uniref:RraA family protein n=1 Tax=Azospirillum canadense TaxID=403962 RepID=UPI002225B791|nr:RraA family protein [Azospirillum canadense]MCW2238037.1 regulator of RNase E activity RraA [Azospirillum canadense]